MKKFLIGVATGLFLAGVTVLIGCFVLVRLGERRPEVAPGSTLIFRISGAIPERPRVEIPLPFFASQNPIAVYELWNSLRVAAADSRIKNVVLMPGGIQAGWAKLDELRTGLVNFKKSGKPLIAYLVNPGAKEYYLATAADKIYMAPEDLLYVKGLRAELIYVRKTLDKLGIQMEVEHIGKYKDAGDMFSRTSATPETLTVMNSVLDGVYGQLVDGIAAGRKQSAGQIRADIDEGPFLAREAKAKGLVDDLLYQDQMFDEVKQRTGGELKKVELRDYLRAPVVSAGMAGKTKIALVVGEGAITAGGDGISDEESLTAKGFCKMLREAGDDATIRGVIVRVDSPGGDAIASDNILREVKLLSKKKPLVISMSDMAASGGYYISSSGDPILSYSNTFTGSIGVIFAKPNLRGLYDKIGVQKEILTRGRFAAIDSDYQPMDKAAREKLRAGMDEIYTAFIGHVAEGRHRKPEQIAPLAEGRVWLGSQAKQNGLVDEIGGLDRAIELVKARAHIAADAKIRLVPFPAHRSLFDLLLESSMNTAIDPSLRQLLKDADLSLWARGGLLKVMPYKIDVK